MKKITILSLIFLSSISLVSFSTEVYAASSGESAVFSHDQPFSEKDQKLFAHLQAYRSNYAHPLGLFNEDAPDNVISLNILTQTDFEQKVDQDPRKLADMKKFGFVDCEGVIFAVKSDTENNQVPTLPTFWQDLRSNLPSDRTYQLVDTDPSMINDLDLYQWAVSGYKVRSSKAEWKSEISLPSLVVPEHLLSSFKDVSDKAAVELKFRDLFTTRTNQFTPAVGAMVAKSLEELGASVEIITGQRLQDEYNLVHEVGKGAEDQPYVSIVHWRPINSGDQSLPKIYLTGKGVCFDTGGYNIKADPNDMWKDKGGALSVLALAEYIMRQNLSVDLTVTCGWVINAISGNATYPFDIYPVETPWGKKFTVEQKNTDAEGRIVQGGMMKNHATKDNAMVISMQTLTGGQLVALTENSGAFYAYSPFTEQLKAAFEKTCDALWQLPYDERVLKELKKGTEADIKTITGSYGSSIQGAMFLKEFVENPKTYIHFDIAGISRTQESCGVHGTFEFIKEFASNWSAPDVSESSSS